MKRYEKYTDSGIEWVGKIPERWAIVHLKYLLTSPLQYGANESAEFDDISYPRYIRITDFGDDGKLKDETFKSLPYNKAEGYFLEDGDILFARSGATVGKTFQFKNYEGEACFAGYLIKASPNREKVTSDFLYYFTKSNSYSSWKDSIFNQATIQNIGADKYKELKVVIPPLSEQTAIASFLDHKTAQIDALIEKKEQLIEKLKAQRQAIINEAVTKGLNPNVPMKDSGIEWLGKIPAHWTFCKAKRNTYMKGRIGWQGLKQDEFTDEGPYLITGMNFKDGVIRWDEAYHITQERYDQAPEIQLNEGDVLMTKDGTIGKLLYVDYLPGPASLNSHLLVLRCIDDSYIPKFLYYQLMTNLFQEHIELTKTGTTFFGITQEAVGNYQMLLPPINEQIDIVNSIEVKIRQIKALLSKSELSIEKLKLYRQSLISEVVTGKIDVRDWETTKTN